MLIPWAKQLTHFPGSADSTASQGSLNRLIGCKGNRVPDIQGSAEFDFWQMLACQVKPCKWYRSGRRWVEWVCLTKNKARLKRVN
jgi:hypothetical protein